MSEPSPVSITAAALIMQFSIILIMAFGAAVLAFRSAFTSPGMAPLILLLAIITLGVLMFSDALSTTWAPLFGSSSFNGLKWSTSLYIVFLIDVIAVAILVMLTGGSMASAFTPIYFIIPPLAIFLRESDSRIVGYLVLVILLFTINYRGRYERGVDEESGTRWAFWLVSVLCLTLATYIGYVTRPL